MISSREAQIDGPRRSVRGFTLFEVLFAVALLTLIMAMMIPTMSFLSRSVKSLESHISHRQQNRYFFQRLPTDLRSTTNMTSSIKKNSATLTLTTQDVSGSTHTVVYKYTKSNGRLTRKYDTGKKEVILENLTSFAFTFYDSKESVTSNDADVKMVEVDFTQNDRVVDRKIQDTATSTRYVLRNRAI